MSVTVALLQREGVDVKVAAELVHLERGTKGERERDFNKNRSIYNLQNTTRETSSIGD